MKLKNLIAPLQQNIRKTLSLLRFNPLSEQGRRSIANSLINRGRRRLENLEIPQGKSFSVSNQSNVLEDTYDYTFAPLPNLYPQYQKCYRNDPLGCDRPLETLKKAPLAKFCSQCGFPAQLPENKEIRGKRGIYQIKRFLGRQGNGRIYAAVQQNSGKSIVIKEYLLPNRCFREEIIRQQKKEIFARVVNFQVAETIPTDFRLIIPQEGIGDRNQDRCYLITSSNLASLPNLKTYLAQQGRMEQEQIIKLLDQVLQSLEFLHSHKWQFTSGEIKQGLVHGNLSLDNLLIRQTEVGFLVYLWDLSFWENIFDPRIEEVSTKRVIDDLEALGNIGFYLLAAKEIAVQSFPLNPRNELNWRGISSPIKNFLLQLLGLNSRFEDAATARKKLRQLMLKPNDLVSSTLPSSRAADAGQKTINWLVWIIGSAIFLGSVSVIGWSIFNKNKKRIFSLGAESCIKDIKNVPTGNFTYSIVALDKSQNIAAKRLKNIFNINDTYKNAYKNICGLDSENNSFIEVLSQTHQLELELSQKIFNNQKELINNINPALIDFALMNLDPNQYQDNFIRDDRKQVINKIVAYDGLLVYVPFEDCQNCEQLGRYLEQKITLKQLRDIYTAKVSYWHEINPKINYKIPLKAFVPQDNSALELFKQLVFENQEDIAALTEAIESGKIQKLESYSILQEIRKLWQRGNIADGTKIGGIGFDFQEIAYKQCNIYPLTVLKNSSAFFPMLVKQDQTGVNLFEDLSCKDDKQHYQLNTNVFRNYHYPLAFSLNLLYLNENKNDNLELGKKMVEILKTKEFQCHLSHKKLIPLELSETECK